MATFKQRTIQLIVIITAMFLGNSAWAQKDSDESGYWVCEDSVSYVDSDELWEMDLWDLRSHSAFGRTRLPDFTTAFQLESAHAETCTFYNSKDEEEYSYTSSWHEGYLEDYRQSEVVVYIEQDVETKLSTYSMYIEVPDGLGGAAYLYGTIFETFREEFSGYVDGEAPTHDGRWINVRGEMDIYPYSPGGRKG